VLKFLYFIFYIIFLIHTELFAQDLEPRRWTVMPAGMNVVSIGYGRTTGDLLFDPVLQVEDAEITVDTLYAVYVRSFNLGDIPSRIDVLVPWQSVRWEGLLSGEVRSVERKGFANPRFRFSTILFNTAKDDPASTSKTVVGAAISVGLPLGEYYEEKLLNIGYNRFVIRPQIGVVHTEGPWSGELTGSVFFYTDNDEFYDNGTREQDPIYTLQSHLIYMFEPGLWASISVGYGWGGLSWINGESQDDKWGNLLAGVALAAPLTDNQGVKVTYLYGRTQKATGSLSGTFGLSWSIRF
jgi:hypothetical protein